MEPLTLALLFFACGLIIGGLISYVLAVFRLRSNHLPQSLVDEKYVGRDLFDQISQRLEKQELLTERKEEEMRLLGKDLATYEESIRNLEKTRAEYEKESERLRQETRIQFENVANKLLEEKSAKFVAKNQEQLAHLLDPLREKIKSFEDGVEKRFLQETRDRINLKKEIEQLHELNQQLSQDANNLASALKGDQKMLVVWGEMQLEMLLQKAGLAKDIHYRVQPSFKDENGKHKRPDFIIQLPDEKHLILDSKVSLKAYDQFFRARDDEQRAQHIKAHLGSIRAHIKSLSDKNYQQLYQIDSPDYLLLFIPIEPAFALAVREDSSLFDEALDKNIVIVTTSTLLATMRTVSFIWKQEKQKKSVLEIARQSGLLYDKFCNFVDDLKGIGKRIEQANDSYNDAMNKLVDSKKFGDTLVGRAEKIRELGAEASKSLPKDLLER
ncbi:MAG: DNA recombination protein RmuC [Saprospiraceae bacterium]|nr:DNA recombination protein RmuC [Saprospiraceae bacterium]